MDELAGMVDGGSELWPRENGSLCGGCVDVVLVDIEQC